MSEYLYLAVHVLPDGWKTRPWRWMKVRNQETGAEAYCFPFRWFIWRALDRVAGD